MLLLVGEEGSGGRGRGEEAVEFAISSGGLFCNIYVFMLQTYSSHTDVSNVVGHLAYDFF